MNRHASDLSLFTEYMQAALEKELKSEMEGEEAS